MMRQIVRVDACVQTLALAEGSSLKVATVASGTAAIVATNVVTLPSDLTVNLDASGATVPFPTTLLSSDGGFVGDTLGWSVDTALPEKDSWRVALHKIGGGCVLTASPNGMSIIFR